MALSDAGTPPTRLSAADRSTSSHSITKQSPSNKPRQQKAHVVGHSGLNAHSRNRSYGKNLNNLAKLAKGVDEGTSSKGHKQRDRSKSPTSKHVKRNSSNVSLPRVGSKASIKRNTSNVSLKKNSSSAHVNKTSSRPTTPVRRTKSPNEGFENVGSKVTFQMDEEEDENNDDNWTEESNSQSPSITRYSSASRGGGRSGKSTPGEYMPHEENQPPTQPEDQHTQLDGTQDPSNGHAQAAQQSYQQNPAPSRHKSRPPDADAITSRLLNRGTSFKLEPQITSISATGTPGTQTPPVPQSQESSSLNEPSMPADGISRFLNANSSSASSTWQLNSALSHLQTPPTPNPTSRPRTRSPSPSRPAGDDPLRKAKSTANLAATGLTAGPAVSRDPDSSKGPVSYTFEPATRRPAGGNTQAKLDLWRTQTHVEPAHNPPAPMMKGANAAAMMGVEEKRARLFEDAEAELGYLRRFKNPVVEGARRAVKVWKRREKAVKALAVADGRSGGVNGVNGEAVNGLDLGNGPGFASGSASGHGERGRERGEASRPVSRAGPRAVRFEVGLDPGDDLDESPEQADGLEALLRSLWAGGEMENVGD
ncbi:MAG: hypothetical protein MMC23_005841 [Stictis urceolatum]|nr:hypothetical protein [Stictis urceolata]